VVRPDELANRDDLVSTITGPGELRQRFVGLPDA